MAYYVYPHERGIVRYVAYTSVASLGHPCELEGFNRLGYIDARHIDNAYRVANNRYGAENVSLVRDIAEAVARVVYP